MYGCIWQRVYLGLSIDQVVNLTEDQLELLSDRAFLLEKKRIISQIVLLLSQSESQLKTIISASDFEFPPNAFLKAGKISKGDSYLDLPYFVLDYPRLFTKEDVFAYRVMVRWGHEIGFTLHLGGLSKSKHEQKIKDRKPQLADYYLCVNDSPWEYHFETSNFQKVSEMEFTTYSNCFAKDFIKLSHKVSLSEINQLPTTSTLHLTNFLKLLA